MSRPPLVDDARGIGSVVGIALLVLVAALAAGVVGAATLSATPNTPPPQVVLAASADAGADRIALTHRGGDALPVDRLRVVIYVGGERLAHQPPIPFFAAHGFESGPTGPFNVADGGRWQAGETAAVRLAGTNSHRLSAGTRVRVVVYHGAHELTTVTTRAA